MLSQNTISKLQEVDFVIYDTDSIAVGIRYEPEKSAAPYATVRVGKRDYWEFMQLADEFNVPAFENSQLALYGYQNMYYEVEAEYYVMLIKMYVEASIQIGIFWLHDNVIYKHMSNILKHKLTSKSNKNFKISHRSEWARIQEENEIFKVTDYKTIPRGRVLVKNGEVYVYGSCEIINNESHRELVEKKLFLSDVKNIHWKCHRQYQLISKIYN